MVPTIVGIDYGKKLAGTTVLCYIEENGHLHWKKAAKDQDADKFLFQEIEGLAPEAVFMDAPLSLPGVYRFGHGYDDYFYREPDRQLGAMSPMFLAGLTARAIRFKDAIAGSLAIPVYEVYPKALAQYLALDGFNYKGKKAAIHQVAAVISRASGIPLPDQTLPDWHHVDAFLALVTGYRWIAGNHEAYGKPEEGRILV
jgi:predicted nuclease with RNAse H fold